PGIDSVNRRRFLAASAGTALTLPLADAAQAAAADAPAIYQATGVKVGEVTESSAIVWTRLTASPTRNSGGTVIPKRGAKGEPRPQVTVPVAQIEGACPGA